MAEDKRDILEVLKSELEFLEQGGYGRSVRTPWLAPSIFQDSPSCLNFNDPSRPEPCNDCILMEFVPQDSRLQDVPCHHILVGPKGETVDKLENNQLRAEDALREWLKAAIRKIEQERANKAMTA